VDKVITTTFMIIISIVVTLMLSNAVIPAVQSSRDALVSMSGRLNDRMKSQITVIHASGELDSSATWQDINGDGDFDVFVWVKNVGALRIPAVEALDIMFGPEGNFVRIPYKDQAGGTYPYWEWQVENAARWDPTSTLKITIKFSTVLASERYFLKVIMPNGIVTEYYFSM